MRIKDQWWKLGGACGIFFFVVFLIGGIILQGDGPSFDDSAETIRTYWVENGEDYLFGDWLTGIAFILGFLPFAIVLTEVVHRLEGEPALFSRLTFAGALLSIAFAAAAGMAWGALAMGADQMGDDAIIALTYIDTYGFSFLGVVLGLMIGSASVGLIRMGGAWRVLAAIGFIIFAVGVITPLGVMDGDPEDGVLGGLGFIPFVGSFFWILATSISLLMLKTEPAAQVEGVTPATA